MADRGRKAFPVSSPLLADKWSKKNHDSHRERLNTMKKMIDNTEPVTTALNPGKNNVKKQQKLLERQEEVDLENQILLDKLIKIKTTETRPMFRPFLSRSTFQLKAGLYYDTNTGRKCLDHFNVPASHVSILHADSRPASADYRKQQAWVNTLHENSKLLRAIEETKPFYSVSKLEDQHARNCEHVARLSNFRGPEHSRYTPRNFVTPPPRPSTAPYSASWDLASVYSAPGSMRSPRSTINSPRVVVNPRRAESAQPSRHPGSTSGSSSRSAAQRAAGSREAALDAEYSDLGAAEAAAAAAAYDDAAAADPEGSGGGGELPRQAGPAAAAEEEEGEAEEYEAEAFEEDEDAVYNAETSGSGTEGGEDDTPPAPAPAPPQPSSSSRPPSRPSSRPPSRPSSARSASSQRVPPLSREGSQTGGVGAADLPEPPLSEAATPRSRASSGRNSRAGGIPLAEPSAAAPSPRASTAYSPQSSLSIIAFNGVPVRSSSGSLAGEKSVSSSLTGALSPYLAAGPSRPGSAAASRRKGGSGRPGSASGSVAASGASLMASSEMSYQGLPQHDDSM